MTYSNVVVHAGGDCKLIGEYKGARLAVYGSQPHARKLTNLARDSVESRQEFQVSRNRVAVRIPPERMPEPVCRPVCEGSFSYQVRELRTCVNCKTSEAYHRRDVRVRLRPRSKLASEERMHRLIVTDEPLQITDRGPFGWKLKLRKESPYPGSTIRVAGGLAIVSPAIRCGDRVQRFRGFDE